MQVHTGLQFNVKRWVLVLDALFRESAQQNSWPLGTRCSQAALRVMGQSCFPPTRLPRWQIWCNFSSRPAITQDFDRRQLAASHALSGADETITSL